MGGVDYDRIAGGYDERYRRHRYPGIEAALAAFAGPQLRVLEVGCGTGHWLSVLARAGARVSGLDASAEMLARARAAAPEAELIQGRAEALLWPDACFDRVVCINALHHFDDKIGFVREARRVLTAGGAAMIVGLDPHRDDVRWWIYDHFEGARERDRARYPAPATLRAWMAAAGFTDVHTAPGEHLVERWPARAAIADGAVASGTTSQLAMLSSADYARGMGSLERAIADAEARGEVACVEADLHLPATVGTVHQ